MKIQSVLRPGLPGILLLLLTAERCVEITGISARAYASPGCPSPVKTRLKRLENGQNDFNPDYYLSYDRIWNPEDIPLGSLASFFTRWNFFAGETGIFGAGSCSLAQVYFTLFPTKI